MKCLTILGISAFLASAEAQEYGAGFLVNDIGCKQFSIQNNKCIQCSNRYYMDGQSICQPVNTNCKEYNPNNGACTSCYDGFLQIEDTCLPKFILQQFDFNCNQFVNGECVKCSKGYYFDDKKKCKGLDSNCSSHNQSNGQCLSCYSGYQLVKNSCVRQALDPGCKTYTNGVCQECSFGFYFANVSQKLRCLKIDEKCKNFDIATQKCLQCYQGFALSNNQCMVETPAQVSDPNCREWKNGVCTQCSKGAFFNNAGKCITVDPQCKKFDYVNKMCVECYTGFKIEINGGCIEDKSFEISDPLCKEWRDKVCVECSFGAYRDSKTGMCKMIDATCKRFNFVKQNCQECYPGYQLTLEKNCKEAVQLDPKFKFCKEWNKQQTICLQCSSGTYFNRQKECVQIDPFCQDFDKVSEVCRQCYRGYKVTNGKCSLKTKQDIDVYCVKFSSNQESFCVECAARFFVGSSGKCQEVSNSCKDYNKANGTCISCYSGYTIQKGECVIDKTIKNDPNCKTWLDGICTQCAKGSYLAKNGRCQAFDPQCKKFDQVAAVCVQCYSGFAISFGKCVQDKEFKSRDPFCSQFQKDVCVKCSHGFYFNEQRKCTQTNPQCATVNVKNGKCLSCFSGYRLTENDDCVKQQKEVSDLFCAKFDKQNKCIECSKGFYFNKLRKCSTIDPICKVFDQKIQGCVDCYAGFVLKNLKCVIDQAALKESRCAEWRSGVCVRCSDRSYMGSNGKCIEISILCKTYDQQNGRCKSCYPGYALQQTSGECEAGTSIVGCAEINQNGECVKCSKGYYLSQGTNSCEQVDPDCADFDLSAFQCRGCYAGYSLVSKKCVLNKVDDSKKIQNCAKYDGMGSCIECFDRFYLWKEGRGQCKDVSFFCKTYNKNTGACNTCYTGFKLQGTQCVSE